MLESSQDKHLPSLSGDNADRKVYNFNFGKGIRQMKSSEKLLSRDIYPSSLRSHSAMVCEY